MKTTYTVLRPDGAQVDGEVDWPQEPGYDRISSVVRPLLDGADLEHVSVLFQNRPHDMFVDEEGLIKGLMRNEAATAVYRRNWLSKARTPAPTLRPSRLSQARRSSSIGASGTDAAVRVFTGISKNPIPCTTQEHERPAIVPDDQSGVAGRD